ncbi:MAG: hypothetical protein QOC77_1976 [Thermoleophilaceae bacterium]|nr:hypothetical protein [Thermoleophilaceae bacterium]MEA2471143.1 hypothetical protein [Thermoleophilaceae bacterium]
MITDPASLAELAARGSGELSPYLGRPRPPDSALEWLGIAVARLPDLAARARMSDQINRRQTRAAHLHEPLLDALNEGIAGATALAARALACHLERHPASAEGSTPDADVEAYATLLVDAHRSAPRRAEFLIGGYSSFLGGAIEAAGALGDAELAAARKRRWDRSDPEQLVGQRAGQVYSAVVNALGGLLAYARLITEDSARRPPEGSS